MRTSSFDRKHHWTTTAGALTVACCMVALGFTSLASASTTKVTVSTSQSETTAIKAVKWTSNVTTSYANGSWTFTSSGLPASNFIATDYAVPANPFAVDATGASVVASASIVKAQNYAYTLPLKPVYEKTTTTTNQGPIGFLLDGAALYNPYEANHSTVATSDNFIATENGVTASFLDTCDGHPGPGGQYHYHGLPSCLVTYATGGTASVSSVTNLTSTTTPAVTSTNTASKEPLILGFAFDGYGIYDNIAMNGSTVPVSSLDACNGIFSAVPGYPKGVYHYVLENVEGARSSIGCYHGLVSSSYTHALESLFGVSPKVSTSTSDAPATAYSLAANMKTVAFWRAMLRVSGLNNLC